MMEKLRMTYESDGVPVLSADDIERHATRFLRVFDPPCLSRPRRTPIPQILDRLVERYHVKVTLDHDLGYSAGRKVLGRIRLHRRLDSVQLCIDPSIVNSDGRFRFTAAHELGHMVLHRHRTVLERILRDDEFIISDVDTDLYLGRDARKEFTNPRGWLEYHANNFAASLLMPRATVSAAVSEAQRDIGVTRNLGVINLDRQPANRTDYRRIVDKLALVYGVSNTVIKIRLRQLDILKIVERHRLFHISELFTDACS